MMQLDTLNKTMEEYFSGDNRLLKAWSELAIPQKEEKRLTQSYVHHWDCGPINASLFLVTSYVNLYGLISAETDAVHIAAQAAGVDMDEVKRKISPIASKNLLTCIKNPVLIPAAALLLYLTQQTYSKCKPEKLAIAMKTMAEHGVFEAHDEEIAAKYLNEYFSEICPVFTNMEQIYSQVYNRIVNREEDEEVDKEHIETVMMRRLSKWTEKRDEITDTYSAESVAACFLFDLANGTSIHKSLIGNIVLSQLVLCNAKFKPFHSKDDDKFLPIEKYPCPMPADFFGITEAQGSATLRQDYFDEWGMDYDQDYTAEFVPVVASWNVMNKPNDDVLERMSSGKATSVKNETLDFLTQRVFPVNPMGPLVSKQIDTIISELTCRPFYGQEFVIEGLCREMALSHGLSDQEARDLAIIIATIRRINAVEFGYRCSAADYAYKMEPKKDIPQQNKDSSVSTQKYQALERQAKEKDNELQEMRHQISTLKRDLSQKEEALRERDEIIDTYEQLIKDYETPAAETADSESGNSDSQFPCHFKKNIVLYGGFESFHAVLTELLPDIRIIPKKNGPIDPTPFRNADIIFIQPNYLGHSAYYYICDVARTNKIPYISLRNASPKVCAKFILDTVGKLSRD